MSQRFVQIYVFATMFLFSMTVNSIAPLLLTIQEQYGISVAASSVIPLLNTLFGIAANIIGGMIIAQVGTKNTINIAIFSGLTGSIIFAFSRSFLTLCLAAGFIGFGVGLAFMSLSTQYSHLEEKYQNFGLFHAFFGFGGITAPLLVALIQRLDISYSYLYIGCAVLFAVFFVYSVFSKGLPNIRYEKIRLKEAGAILKKPVVYLTVMIFFLYAASEIGMITWNGNLFHDGFGTTKEYASFILSIFWMIFTFGRIITDAVVKKAGMINVFRIVSTIVIVCIPLLVFTGQPLFLFIIAISFAPVFPTAQKYGNKYLKGRESGLYNGIVFMSGTTGAAIFVTLMGQIADFNVFAAYAIPFLCFVGIRIVVFFLGKTSSTETSDA
ncbi:MAG: MFS transporter [Spirochaetia bacterium]